MVTRDNVSGAGVSVAVIGAGLAGAACARALALRGFRVSVFERESQPATAASGNPIGILHPLISADRNLASQWVEAGVATTLRWLRDLQEWTSNGQNVIARPQSGRGNLRSQTIGEQCPVLQMNADCSELIHYTSEGAWIRPAEFVRACLDQACAQGAKIVFDCELQAIHQQQQTHQANRLAPDRFATAPILLEFSVGPIQAFDHVILANGQGVIDLLPQAQLRLNAIRGTITSYSVSRQHSLPCIICATGYATPVIDGDMVVGASYERMDQAGLITKDPISNLERLESISAPLARQCAQAPAKERTSIRIATHDRMPHIGRVLGQEALLPSMSQLHHVPRSDRVWVLAGLGSRGLSFAPIGAEVIADQLSGRSPAVSQRLLDAADPVRFALRRHQRRASPACSC
jgi:tRNA 5-methylaminomethyl-2-thiouridine biosynthesis bifunctional protein